MNNNVIPISPDVEVDVLQANANAVFQFTYRFHNDKNKATHSMMEQVAHMMMDNVHEIRASEAWRDYRSGLGEFHWLEHEFDYFLASHLIPPVEYARIVRNGSIPLWAELVNTTNPGRSKRGKTRRPVDDVAAQIRQGVPGGHGDPEVWVQAARQGFGDWNERALAADPKKVKAAVKAGSVTAVARSPRIRIGINQTRDESLTLDEQRARMILAYLDANPRIARIVKKGPS